MVENVPSPDAPEPATGPAETARSARPAPVGLKAIAAINGLFAALFLLVGIVVVLVASADYYVAAVADVVAGFQIPVVVGASLIVLGAVVFLVSRDLWRGREEGRVGTLAIATIAVLAFYVELQLAGILLFGELFANTLLTLAVSGVVASGYAVPVLLYLDLPRIRAFTRGVPVSKLERAPAPAPTGGAATGSAEGAGFGPGPDDGEGSVLTGEVVAGGQPLQPDNVVVGQPLASGSAAPPGAVAKTTCAGCSTPLAVTTAQRPVVVECPQCGSHGRLSRRPGEWPGYQ